MEFKGRNRNKEKRSVIDRDVLSINCRDCGRVPDPASAECIRCIVAEIKSNGCASRIRLRTGSDIEISGPAAEMLCELSFTDGLSASMKTCGKRKCRSCGYSPERILGIARESFPVPDFAGARGRLMSFRPNDELCGICVQRTYRSLDQAELSMSELSDRISSFVKG